MKKSLWIITLIVLAAATVSAQGWINVTPPGFTDPTHFKTLKFQNGSPEIHVWGDTLGYQSPDGTNWTPFMASYAYACNPFELAVGRLSDFDKAFTNQDYVVSYFVQWGCIVECWGMVYRDTNGVLSMNDFRYGFDDFLCNGWNASVAFSRVSDQDVFLTFLDSMYYSSDGGGTFAGISSPDSLDFSPRLNLLAVNPHASGILFTGGETNDGYRLYESIDAGHHWTPGISIPSIYQLEFHPVDPAVMILASDSGIYRSTNGGTQWTNVLPGSFQSVEIVEQAPETVVAGDGYGRLYRSTDAGATWALYNNSFTTRPIIGLYALNGGDTVIVGARDGVFKVYAPFVLDARPENLPASAAFELLPNYPNPFNPATTIPFVISTASPVTVSIFNVLGQEVRTLFRGVKQPGRYTVQWDGTDDTGNQVGSGLYFCRLKVANRSQSRRLMLLR